MSDMLCVSLSYRSLFLSFVPAFRCSVPDRWSAAKSKASEWGAWVEVMFGMILVAELLLPRRCVQDVHIHADLL